jgi:hypothetical protein
MSEMREMPNCKTWRKELIHLRGKAAAEIMDKAEKRFWKLYSERTRYKNKALVQHLEENILPSLAVYQALKAHGDETEQAYQTVYDLNITLMAPNRRFFEFLGRFRWFYGLIKRLTPKIMKRSFPENAWEMEWVELSDEVVAFNLHSCFYLDTLRKYGAEELAPMFCSLDDYIYTDVSPHVRWGRTQTLAAGGEFCDFRYYRVRPGEEPKQ